MTSMSFQASAKNIITYCHHNIHLLYKAIQSHISNYIYALYKHIMVNKKNINIKINSQTTFYTEEFRMNLNKDSVVEFCSMPLFIICIAKSPRSFQSYPVLFIPVVALVT